MIKLKKDKWSYCTFKFLTNIVAFKVIASAKA